MSAAIKRPELDVIFPAGRPPVRVVELDTNEGPAYSLNHQEYKAHEAACQVWWAHTLWQALQRRWSFWTVSVAGFRDGFCFYAEPPDDVRHERMVAIIDVYLRSVDPNVVNLANLAPADWERLKRLAIAKDAERAAKRNKPTSGLRF